MRWVCEVYAATGGDGVGCGVVSYLQGLAVGWCAGGRFEQGTRLGAAVMACLGASRPSAAPVAMARARIVPASAAISTTPASTASKTIPCRPSRRDP